MQLKYCSITGADDAVEPQALTNFSAQFPFAEWAILLLPAMAGKPRFPTLAWIENFKTTCKDTHKAMHLCGEALIGFVEGKKEIYDIMNGFDRIQLNLKFGDIEGKYDPALLLERVKENPQFQFIIQYTHDKATLLPLLKDIPNHAVLFDASAGRGISPEEWDAPLSGHFCGYAGGINPDNVEKNLAMILQVAATHDTWIDMETGVRTNDVFDFDKVKRVLQSAQKYV